MSSLLGFRTGTRLMTTFSTITGAFYPSGSHPGTCKLCALISASFEFMAHQGYHHIVSTAPVSLKFVRRTIEYSLKTLWSMSTHCKLCTNKIWKPNWHSLQLYWINKVHGIAKPSAKIYIAIFYRAGHSYGNNTRDPSTPHIWFMWPGGSGCVRGGGAGKGSERSAVAHPTHIPTPPSMGAGCLHCQIQPICPRGIPAHLSRLVTKQFSILSPHSWNSLTEFWPDNAVPCEFWQSTICHPLILEGNPAPIVYNSGSQLTAPNYVQQTKQ